MSFVAKGLVTSSSCSPVRAGVLKSFGCCRVSGKLNSKMPSSLVVPQVRLMVCSSDFVIALMFLAFLSFSSLEVCGMSGMVCP